MCPWAEPAHPITMLAPVYNGGPFGMAKQAVHLINLEIPDFGYYHFQVFPTISNPK